MIETIKNRRFLIYLLAIIVLLVLIIPVNLPYYIPVQGKILAGQEWRMVKQDDGSLLISLRDNHNDLTKNFTAFQVERGDVFQFLLKENFINERYVNAGDTLGIVYSYEMFEDLKRIEGELAIARANLQVNLTGEKESIINQARDEYLLNVERAEVQSRILQRQSKLYSDALISSEEFEITRGMARISDLEAKVADAQLKALETGEKPEMIQMVESQIEAIENELLVVKKKLSSLALVTPISGEINTAFSLDTLLLVHDDVRLVLMQIPWDYLTEISPGHVFSGTISPLDLELDGDIIFQNNMLGVVGGKQVFYVIGQLSKTDTQLPVNMIIRCSIEGNPRTILDHVINFFRILVS